MQANSRARRSTALILLAAISLTQGCRSFQRHSGPVPTGSRTRIESVTPFLISSTSGASAGCSAAMAEGVVSDATREAITFESFRRVEAGDKSCSSITAGTITLGADDEVRVHRFSSKRTLLLLGTIAGLVALAISQVDIGFGDNYNPGCGVVC